MSRSDAERDAMIAQRMRGALTHISNLTVGPDRSSTVWRQIQGTTDSEVLRTWLGRCIETAKTGLARLPDRHTHVYDDLLPTVVDSEVIDRHLTAVHHWPAGKSRQFGVGHLTEVHAAEHDGGVLDPEPVPQPIPPAEVEQTYALAAYVAVTAADNRQISGNIQVTLDKPVDLQRIRDVEAFIATDLRDNSGTSVRQAIITGIFPLDPPRVSE